MPTASVLVRRGLSDPGAARRFIEASESHDPFEFRGMDGAVALLLDHVGRGSLIAVHGDYDVDGVCSTAVAVEALEALGAKVKARLPSRSEDGYGLSARTVRELHGQGARLLLTTDCGIGALEEVELARSLGMDVLVTDHHRPGERLPECAVVHPAVCGYPCPDLCATGVVYKLAQALHAATGQAPEGLERVLDLVALATIADVVPLVGENRTLAKEGLRALAGTGRPGLRALMRVAGVEPQSVREHTVGFVLAPRLNAAGRLYRADASLELLLTTDSERALAVARELDAINSERQAVETRILFEAEHELSAVEGRREEPALVLAGEGWHAGVIGIVASRLVERYHRPTVLIALEDGRGRGSGRSISPYDLHAGLAACDQHLARFGGHRMAAGLEIEASRVDAFRADLVAHAGSALRPEDLVPKEVVDAVVPGDAVGLELAEELELLRPFGMGNPGVNLLVPAARTSDVRSMGEGRHSRFTVHSAGVRTPVVAFGVGRGALDLDGGGARHDLVARLERNEWRGAVEPRLVLRSLHGVATGEPCEPVEAGGCASCTCRARGEDWWEAARAAMEGRESLYELPANGVSRAVLDRRGEGILGALSDLLATGEPVAILSTDCSRRRSLLEVELRGERFGRSPGVVLSSRCARDVLDAARSPEAIGFALLDYETACSDPALLARFTHLFAVDPPPLERALAFVSESGAPGSEAYLHLGWGSAEVELAVKALEHDYGLRAPLTAIYRALAAHPAGVEGEALEALLAGDGRHPRPPALAGRCLRILAELDLVELEPSSATVRCTITSVGKGRVELERSEAFRACSTLCEEGLRFLSEQAQPERKTKAA